MNKNQKNVSKEDKKMYNLGTLIVPGVIASIMLFSTGVQQSQINDIKDENEKLNREIAYTQRDDIERDLLLASKQDENNDKLEEGKKANNDLVDNMDKLVPDAKGILKHNDNLKKIDK